MKRKSGERIIEFISRILLPKKSDLYGSRKKVRGENSLKKSCVEKNSVGGFLK